MIAGCYHKKSLPIYGKGNQVRDWIFVDDHSEAVWSILEKGEAGSVYDIGGENERKNIDLLHSIIEAFASLKEEDAKSLKSLIAHVEDRPGHDFRYAIDCSKTKQETGWRPLHDLSSGIRKTVAWYLENPERLGDVFKIGSTKRLCEAKTDQSERSSRFERGGTFLNTKDPERELICRSRSQPLDGPILKTSPKNYENRMHHSSPPPVDPFSEKNACHLGQ